MSIFLMGIGNPTVSSVGGNRHYLGSHIVDPFPRTPKPNKSL